MPFSAIKKAPAHKGNGATLKKPAGPAKSVVAPAGVVVLYLDSQRDSLEAERRLQSLGVELDIERSPVATEVFPTAVYRGWIYRGLDKIDILREQITFQSTRRTGTK